VGFFVLAKDVHASPLYVCGIGISFLGGYFFTMAKYYQVSAKMFYIKTHQNTL
jgi:ABC-type transporter Mla maintaining outer membrane lipid asymmetry permease subunit MlaE